MKRFFIYIGIVGGIVSCRPAGPRLQHGDLLFQVGAASEMSGAIAAATGKENNLKYTHVGIVLAENGVDSVLEATSDAGVRIVPLKDFLARSARIGGASAVTAMRLRDTAGVAASVRRARQFVGQPYDYSLKMRFTLDYFTGYRTGLYCYSTGGDGGYADFDFTTFDSVVVGKYPYVMFVLS